LKLILFLFATALIISGCSSVPVAYYELPVEFRFPEKKAEFIAKHSPYLKNKKIFIDPGHGGADRRNKGSQGLITEADANLSVALKLRDFLIKAGASVQMSRYIDTTVDLKYRSELASKSGADIFISVHHNAPATAEDVWTNYTSTYYHAKETDYEYEPNEHDIARYVQRDLAYAMRNSGGPGSFDGTYSDYIIYPGEGFSVLRLTKIPAILVECGYHTNLNEERRIALEEFNNIEAWGIFRGIARYFSSGIPTIRMIENEKSIYASNPEFTFLLEDSSGINQRSIEVLFDSSSVSGEILISEGPGVQLNVRLNDVKPGKHVIKVIAQNGNGNHSLPFIKEILVTGN
jgi:N-acetylmuramoyl-L-alanine amidase